jgi:hypothetical protein
VAKQPISLTLGAKSFAPRMVEVVASNSPLATTVQISLRVPTEDAQAAIDALKAAGILVRSGVREDDFRGSASYRVVDPASKRPAGVSFTF